MRYTHNIVSITFDKLIFQICLVAVVVVTVLNPNSTDSHRPIALGGNSIDNSFG